MRVLGSLLALALVVLVGWFWSERRSQPEPTTVASHLEAPQLILTHVQQHTTDTAGNWVGSLEASQVIHFDGPARVELTAPDWLSQQGTSVRHIQAATATLRDDRWWTLEEDVRVRQESSQEPLLEIKTDYLEYDTLKDQASTPAAVLIQQAGQMTTQAIGMDIDFSAEEFHLHDQVRTRYWP